MRASSLSNSKIISLINASFVPVHLRNQDFSIDGCAPAHEKVERNRIYRDALASGLPAGSVCVYLLSPDASPVAVAPLNQRVATDPERLAELVEQVAQQLNLPKGEPLIAPTPPSPPACETDSFILQLTARYLEKRGNDLVRLENQSILGTKAGGNWGDLPSQDWIVLTRDEAMQLLPPADVAASIQPGASWELNGKVTAKLLKHFFPPTENTDFEKNRIDEQSLHAQVEAVEGASVRASISGSFRMKHTFYHKDDASFVEATLLGTMEFDRMTRRIRSLRLVTDHATYGDHVNRPQTFGVAVRSIPSALPDDRKDQTNRGRSKLYVTNSAGESVHVIDLETFKVIGEIATGERPHGAAVSADGRRFFTSVESAQKLLVIDTGTDEVMKSISLSGLPNQCAVTPDGNYVGVPIRGGDSVDIVDVAQSRVVKNLPVKIPHNCYNARRNDHIFVTSMGERKVKLIDLKALHYIAEIPVGGVPRPLAVTHDEGTLYCALSDLHGFVIADVAQRKVVQTVELPPLPNGVQFPVPNTPTHGLELTPDERELWVTSCGTDTIYVYDTNQRQVVGKVAVGRGPNWVTFSPDGRYCCVSNVLSDDVSIIDTAKRQETARVKVGSQPKRLVAATVP